MFPRAFEYVAPSTIEEAVDALKGADFAKVMAGGMSLLPLMKLRLLSPDLVVDIGRIGGLDQIRDEGDHVSIGALVRHYQTAASEAVPAALRTAAAFTGDVQVRNRGTTCGAVAHGDIAADQPASVLALGGTIVAQGPGGTREIGAADFFLDALTTALQPDEVVTQIKLPKAAGGSAYDKLGRRGGHTDYAVAGAAAWVAKDNGSISDCRVALTGVAAKPTLASATAEALIGSDGSEGAIRSAAERAAEGLNVLEDLYGSVEYKTHLAQVFARRALTQAIAAAS
ncbi:MAG TPA: xanthine dehydrogenase family protein subunit M [Acidimicrobiia bacterium]|nr:xanthine dehydrogenase family protein subunit M [Acidimicrobiia bacterium]